MSNYDVRNPKLIKLWIGTVHGQQSVRADFSNDRHYEVVIHRPGHAEHVSDALFRMAEIIATDPHLKYGQ